MGAHARRSASGNKRWIACPGSIRLSVGRPNESSEAARLGTAAHGLGEYCLTNRIQPVDMLGGSVYLDEHEDAHVYPPGPHEEDSDTLGLISARKLNQDQEYVIDADMADAVQV